MVTSRVKLPCVPNGGRFWLKSWGTRAAGKGEFELWRDLQESDVKHLWYVFHMTDRHPVPVNFRHHPMHLLSMHRHWARGKFYSTVLAWNPPSQPLAVCLPPYHEPPYHNLLQHYVPECAQLERCGLSVHCNLEPFNKWYIKNKMEQYSPWIVNTRVSNLIGHLNISKFSCDLTW